MGLFNCAKCNRVENTATSAYWTLVTMNDLIYDDSLLEYKGKPLCSKCATLEFKNDKIYVIPPNGNN